ncbi:MAG: TolC family protein, partial [Aquincola tertiaricarbonis]
APPVSSRTRRSGPLSLTYEVPLGGAATARRDDNVARAEAAEAEAWRSLQALRGELAVVRQQALQAADALPALERQRGHLEAVVQASELQYQAGRRSLLQLIDQRDRRFNAEQRAADTRLRLTQAQLRLGVLTGSLAAQWGLATADPSAIPERSTEPTPEWLLPR